MSGDTLATVTLGSTNNIDHLVLAEDITDRYLLLQVLHSPIYFLSNSTTIDLNVEDISLLLTLSQHFLLSMDNNPDGCAVTLHPGNISADGQLTKTILPFLVEAPSGLFSKMLCIDGPQTSGAMRSLNVATDTNNNNWGGLQDGDCLQNFLLVGF